MTAVSSAAKMVAGQLRRWLTGDDEAGADGDNSVENAADRRGGTCACHRLQYRGRSYSDCASASCRGGGQDTAARERSCSVNSRCLTSQGSKRPGSTSGRQHRGGIREVLAEDRELCRCWSGSEEPVCCCERCFVYVDQPPPSLPTPPPYSELILLERYADLAKRLTSTEPSVAAVSTADVTDRVITATEAAADSISSSSSAEACHSAPAQADVKVSQLCSVSFLLTF